MYQYVVQPAIDQGYAVYRENSPLRYTVNEIDPRLGMIACFNVAEDAAAFVARCLITDRADAGTMKVGF